MNALKILFVIDTYETNNNGTSISAQRFAQELRRRGHEVRILCADEKPSDEDITTGNHVANKYILSEFRVPIFDSLIKRHGFTFANIFPIQDRKTINEAIMWTDIVHHFMPFGMGMYVCHQAKKMGKPQTGAFHIQPENLWSSVGLGKVEWLQSKGYRDFRDRFYDHFRHVHVPSRFMKSVLDKFHYQAKIHVISNGIQDEFIAAGKQFADHGRPEKSPELQGKIVIMMVGRLSQEKRQDVIINAVPFSKYADQIQLIFAGRGPEYDKYVELGKQLHYPPMFVYKNRNELIELLGQTDLYIHASDMESEAISCIEAFAIGLVPIIANSDNSATPQFALDGRSLFKPGDQRDLARSIDYWLDHPNERRYVSELYRKEAQAYSLANSVTQFEQMLNEELQDATTA